MHHSTTRYTVLGMRTWATTLLVHSNYSLGTMTHNFQYRQRRTAITFKTSQSLHFVPFGL